MPSAQTLERFIARVESNAHADAIEEFYIEGASMRENMKEPRRGRAGLVAREKEVLGTREGSSLYLRAPVLVDGPIVVVRWIFEFEWLDGTATRMEELAYQRWEGERIAEEQFFYDPAQLAKA